MSEPKPMDPERLAELRDDTVAAGFAEQRAEVMRLEGILIARQDAELAAGPPSEMALLLLHATREITRLRARVRVEAKDVGRAGVTVEKAEAWLAANGWTATVRSANGMRAWKLREHEVSTGLHRSGCWASQDLADTIATVAGAHGRIDWDILDEMAAMVLEGGAT